jgi:N-methylhydantoinase B
MGYGGYKPNGSMFAFFEGLGGGYGARGSLDGVDGVQSHVQNTADAQVEEVEAAFPLRIHEVELAIDTEGAGRHRGGLGIRKEVEFLADGSWASPCDRRIFPPLGLLGGGPGSLQRYELLTPGSSVWEIVGDRRTRSVARGTRVRLTTPGGGGIGPAMERPPDEVLVDVIEGRISTSRAAEVYGVEIVEIDDRLSADVEATARRRTRPSS